MIIRWFRKFWPCTCELCADWDGEVFACVNCNCGLSLYEWLRYRALR